MGLSAFWQEIFDPSEASAHIVSATFSAQLFNFSFLRPDDYAQMADLCRSAYPLVAAHVEEIERCWELSGKGSGGKNWPSRIRAFQLATIASLKLEPFVELLPLAKRRAFLLGLEP